LRLERDGDAAAMKDAEDLAAKTFMPIDPRVALARLPRAQWLHAHGHAQEAAKLASTILADVDGKLVADSPLLARIRDLQGGGDTALRGR
jgi:hypothetical protein